MAERRIAVVHDDSGMIEVKVYHDPDGADEYVCRLTGSPDADYFTNDYDDALNTAEAMVRHAMKGHENAPRSRT